LFAKAYCLLSELSLRDKKTLHVNCVLSGKYRKTKAPILIAKEVTKSWEKETHKKVKCKKKETENSRRNQSQTC